MTETVPSMSGKTCLVTGATAGIGAVTAEALARAGATVIVVGRDPERCAATAARLEALGGGGTAVPMAADLASQAEVRRLARWVLDGFPRLDVLVNNAGAMFDPRVETVDKIEKTWALNHLAYFLLTNLLIDRLTATAPARVVSVASDAHRAARGGIDFDDPEWKRRRYTAFRAYAQSKLANVLFAAELARRLEGTGVTSNSLHPGFVATSFFNGEGRVFRLMKLAARFVAIRPEAGARTSIHLATAPDLATTTGGYFERQRPSRPSRAARDPDAGRRLWALSTTMTGLGTTA